MQYMPLYVFEHNFATLLNVFYDILLTSDKNSPRDGSLCEL